jgi:hypothetical protein
MAITLLAPAAGARAQALDYLYDDAALGGWQGRYQAGLQRNFDTVIRPLLEQAGLGDLASVRIEVPLRVETMEPTAYYSTSPPATITMSATSLKFFDDLTVAVAWLERNGYSNQAPYDYVSMLKYRSAAEIGGRYPPPLEALRIPDDALDDAKVSYIAERIFDSAIGFVLLHELGHLAYGHPGYGPGVSATQAQANEAEADSFALQVMSAASSDPSGMVFLFMGFVHGFPNRGDFASDAEYERSVQNSTHPVTASRVAAVAAWLQSHANDFVTSDGQNTTEPEEIRYIGQQLSTIAQLMEDREWQQITAHMGRLTTPESLTIGRTVAPAAGGNADLAALPEFQGTYEGQIGLPDGTVPIRTVLRRDGDRVTGRYYYGQGEGQLIGVIDSGRLVFRWTEGQWEGQGEFQAADGGMSFTGSWGMEQSADDGGAWTGNRTAQ